MKLTALQRAILARTAEGALYVFCDAANAIRGVASGVPGGPTLRPLGVRMAIAAGYVAIGERRGESKEGRWHQLVLTDAGEQARAGDATKKAP